MKNELKRRGFLGKITKSILGLGISSPAIAADDSKEPKKIKLLTPDGKLVELDQEIIEQKSVKSKATNQDIIDWSKQIKT